MADRYWVGGSGNWNATSTTNWATSSGGASGASAPTSADNVIFDDNSNTLLLPFTVTVTGTSAAPALCADFSTSSLDGAMTLTMGATAFLDVYGSMTLPATNFSVSGTNGAGIRYKSTTTGKTLTTNGVSLGNVAITFDGVGGGWTLGSAYTSTQLITLTNGTFDTGNYNITSTGLSSSNSNTRTLTLGSSTLNFSGTPITFTTSTNFTLNAGTSQINCNGASVTFAGGGLTFYNVSFTSTSAGTATISGANTFNDLTFTSVAATGIRNISIGANQTVSGTLTLGTANTAIRRMFVRSDVVGVARTITAATVATLADVDFRDIVGAGTGTWTGTRLGNCTGNTGITFDAGKTVYCVSALNVNWINDVWALSSGGAVAVNNFPLAQDTVIFDSNSTLADMSFNGAAGFNIGAIDFSGLTTALTFNMNNGVSLYGNLTLDANVTFSGNQGIVLIKNSGILTITSAGRTITNPIGFAGPNNATLQLQDALTISSEISLEEGTLSLNGFNLTCVRFVFQTTRTRSIAFGTNKIVLTGNAISVMSTANLTGFSYTGTPRFESNYSGSTGTRLFDIGRAGGATESNVFDLYIVAGSDIVDLRNVGQSYYRNLDFTGFSGSTSANQQLNIYGDLKYSSGMTVSAGTSMSLLKSTGTQTVTSNGKTIDFPVFKSAAGTLQLLDNMTLGSTRTLTHTAGTLDANDFTLTTGLYSSTGSTARQLDVGTGTLAVSGATFTASGSNYTTAGTGKVSMTSASSKTFAGGGFTYPTLNQGGAGNLIITGANTFAGITNTVQPATIIFPSSTTQNITNFNVSGTSGNLITIESSTSGTQATLNSPSNITNLVSYVSLKDSNAQGGIWQAPSNYNNTILTNVTGWFTGILHADTVVEPCVSNESLLTTTFYGVNLSEGIASNDVNVSQVIYNGNVLEDSTIADITSKTIVASAYANVIGIASVNAYPNANWSAKGSIVGLANVIVNGAPIGYEWTEVPPSSDIWLRQG